ncbi:porin family protein [Microbulbifer thermotolerans]|uniref:hypothetical protein n=1 Tax=Microbulbifer thermotolerans TaxID=252514 RepID=UPI0008E5E7B1|nr:hypothetical protein [Microbulbifer thermotolerans]MCX2780977.1 hypothetical protein [Microbulbifer thermotolerans]MCX2806597.1 hypothetical protein [Microbulbifer thermotolerans]SFC92743.1 hypothetical protein SAMN05660479_02696 [Microbulbifer thermotolerans]
MRRCIWIIPACGGLLFSGIGTALPLYESDLVSLHINGYLTAHQINIDGNTELIDGASRLSLKLETPAYDQWNVGFFLEWGLLAVSPDQEIVISGDQQAESGEIADPLYIRHGNAFAQHDFWGDFRVGKQWSVYYDIAYITDWYNVSGALASGAFALGGDGGVTGTGRADAALTWRKRWKGFGGEFQIGLQYAAHAGKLDYMVQDARGPDTLLVCPTDDCEYGISRGASLTYTVDIGDGLFLGTAYNRVNLDLFTEDGMLFDISDPAFPVLIRDDEEINESGNDFAFIGGIAYGKGPLEEGLYAAFNWHRSHNNEIAPPNSTMGVLNFFNAIGSESYVSWTWGALNCYSIYGGHNLLKSYDDDEFEEGLVTGDKYRLAKYFLGFNYKWNSHVRLYIEGGIDDSNRVAESSGDFIAAGVRVDI